MNKTVSFAILALVALLSIGAVSAHSACGTHEPPRGFIDEHGRVAEVCFSQNQCDNAATRDTFILKADSAHLKMRVNSIYFGSLNGTAKENYDSNMDFFKRKYLELLGIEVILNTTEVTTEYQVVDAGNKSVHLQMAQTYHKPGWMTVLFSTFDPNPKGLLGYASGFPNELPASIADWYTIMGVHGLFSNGTTVAHEIGHMLGLYHVFIQQCDACAEGVNSPDRNVVGDLCNDTLPMQNEPNCNGVLSNSTDCNGSDLSVFPYSSLPLDNYMAYTDDNCQLKGFTAQQSGRARCYLSTALTFLNPSADSPQGSSGPTSAPTTQSPSAASPSSSPSAATPSKTPAGKVSSASQFAAGLTLVAAAMAL